jgi:putative SOS response-associated peptidase YedK
MAPVVRQAEDGEWELTMMCWGMPAAEQYGGHPVTSIRNTRSSHWCRWLGPAHRCLMPLTSFSEWEDTKPKKTPVWFVLWEGRPLFAFAGIWTRWTGSRGPKSAPRRRSRLISAGLSIRVCQRLERHGGAGGPV